MAHRSCVVTCARHVLAVALLLAAHMLVAVYAASLQQVSSFGNNPSNLRMFVYVPDRRAAKPPVVVAVHYCTGSASAFFNGGARDIVKAADQYGFVMVFPEATRSSKCFDVYTKQALTRGGGSDPDAIYSMVQYMVKTYNADITRVYGVGASSGAMTQNVLAGTYPDIFAACAAYSGVPFGCFATQPPSEWNDQCSKGQITHTGDEWAKLVHNAYPSFHGKYPRMQLWHGAKDSTLNYHNFGEELKQWTTVQGVSATPEFTDHPQSTWTRTRYGGTGATPVIEAISISNLGHDLPQSGMGTYVINFFGLPTGGVPNANANLTVNTCATNNGGCGDAATTTCVTSGSGSAVTCACKSGYSGNPPTTACTAVPVNLCATANGGCGDAATTTCAMADSKSRTCACKSGYSGNPPTTACTAVAVNLCATENGGCGDAATTTCAMTDSKSRTCACKSGYTGNPPTTACTAVAVNLCATENGGCGDAATTTCAMAGSDSRTCGCKSGYTGNPPTTACTAPVTTCWASATDAGSNNYWMAFNVNVQAPHAIKTVVVVSGSGTRTPLSGPNNWGTANPTVYSASLSAANQLPFTLEITDAEGNKNTLNIPALAASSYTCA